MTQTPGQTGLTNPEAKSPTETKAPAPPATQAPKPVEYDPAANVHQRIRKVLLAVSHVYKNDTVEMNSERSYTATTHDDVTAVLHMPIAEAGIILRPVMKQLDFTEFETLKTWSNGGTSKTKWYKADLHLEVEFINVDKPEDIFKAEFKSYAMDTSDKSPAKAFSLAMKIILLKVFMLESRDKEEQRDFEKISGNGEQNPPPPRQNQNQNQNQNRGQRQPPPKPSQSAPLAPPKGQPATVPQGNPRPSSADPLANTPPAGPRPLQREELPTTGGMSEPPLFDTSDVIDAAPDTPKPGTLPPVKNFAPPPRPNPGDICPDQEIMALQSFGESKGLDMKNMFDIIRARTGKDTWTLTNFEAAAVRNAFASTPNKNPLA